MTASGCVRGRAKSENESVRQSSGESGAQREINRVRSTSHGIRDPLPEWWKTFSWFVQLPQQGAEFVVETAKLMKPRIRFQYLQLGARNPVTEYYRWIWNIREPFDDWIFPPTLSTRLGSAGGKHVFRGVDVKMYVIDTVEMKLKDEWQQENQMNNSADTLTFWKWSRIGVVVAVEEEDETRRRYRALPLSLTVEARLTRRQQRLTVD